MTETIALRYGLRAVVHLREPVPVPCWGCLDDADTLDGLTGLCPRCHHRTAGDTP